MDQIAPRISIPPAAWKDADGDGSRLLATIDVNDCTLHVEAFAVGRRADMQTWTTNADELSALHAAVGADGGWQTAAINGREYVLVATPYCE